MYQPESPMSHSAWIATHLGDQATLTALLNDCLEHIKQTGTSNAYWRSLPNKVMAYGDDFQHRDSAALVRNFLSSPEAATLKNIILIMPNHAANVVKTESNGQAYWVRTDTRAQYSSLSALYNSGIRPSAVIADITPLASHGRSTRRP